MEAVGLVFDNQYITIFAPFQVPQVVLFWHHHNWDGMGAKTYVNDPRFLQVLYFFADKGMVL